MENVHEISKTPQGRRQCDEKKASSITCAAVVDVAKKLNVVTTSSSTATFLNNTKTRDIECRVPKVRDQTINNNSNSLENDNKTFQACMVADKYLLLDQAEGSLYRCVDVNTQEELVCKVNFFLSKNYFRFCALNNKTTICSIKLS